MTLRMIWDFTNAHDDDGKAITKKMIEEEFSPSDEDVKGLASYGVVLTIEET